MGNTDLPPGTGFVSHGSVMDFKISGKVLIAAVTFLILMGIFIIFLYVYVKDNWIPRITGHGRAHFIITDSEAPTPRRRLGAKVFRYLPVAVFQRSDFKEGIECSVCLSELSDGEKFRLLPKCNHGFHIDCIDMWLHSHFTCPLCRCPVGPVASAAGEVPPETAGGQPPSESPAFSTNVVFWGNDGRFNIRGLSDHSERSLVIAVPNRFADEFPSPMLPLGSNGCSGEKMKSPVEEATRSPGTSKFESLRRILSRAKRSGGSSCSSPVEADIEHGLVSCGVVKGEGCSNVPKTPIST